MILSQSAQNVRILWQLFSLFNPISLQINTTRHSFSLPTQKQMLSNHILSFSAHFGSFRSLFVRFAFYHIFNFFCIFIFYFLFISIFATIYNASIPQQICVRNVLKTFFKRGRASIKAKRRRISTAVTIAATDEQLFSASLVLGRDQ